MATEVRTIVDSSCVKIEGRRPLAISNGCDCRVGLQKGQIGNSGGQKTDQMLKFLVNSRIDCSIWGFLIRCKG